MNQAGGPEAALRAEVDENSYYCIHDARPHDHGAAPLPGLRPAMAPRGPRPGRFVLNCEPSAGVDTDWTFQDAVAAGVVSAARRSEASGSATALRGVGARAGHRLRFSLPAGSDRLAQRTRSGGRSVPCRRVHSLSVAAARKLRSRLLRRPQTMDSAPPSSASIRCLRRRNVASSIPMAASSSSLLCCPLVGHETRRRTYPRK